MVNDMQHVVLAQARSLLTAVAFVLLSWVVGTDPISLRVDLQLLRDRLPSVCALHH